ncbi:MAG: hypothetical protein ABI183_01105, partial [Polyangiaceae bacterium]
IEVRIDASSAFGGARVKFPSSPHAAATLVASSDAGTVRVRESHGRSGSRHHEHREWRQHHVHEKWSHKAGPYRRPAAPQAPVASVTQPNDAELDRVLKMVADGTLSPEDAGEVLRALGHG